MKARNRPYSLRRRHCLQRRAVRKRNFMGVQMDKMYNYSLGPTCAELTNPGSLYMVLKCRNVRLLVSSARSAWQLHARTVDGPDTRAGKSDGKEKDNEDK